MSAQRADGPNVEATVDFADPWAVDLTGEARPLETHVVVRWSEARYAITLLDVAEVVPVPAITRLPGGPIWLAGVANWRGRVLAILDLRPLVGTDQRPLASSARVVVLRHGDREAGVLVDAISGLVHHDGEVGELPTTVPPVAASILTGLLEADGPVAVVDVASVLALGAQLAQASSW